MSTVKNRSDWPVMINSTCQFRAHVTDTAFRPKSWGDGLEIVSISY